MRYRDVDGRLLGDMEDGVEVELVVTEFDCRKRKAGHS